MKLVHTQLLTAYVLLFYSLSIFAGTSKQQVLVVIGGGPAGLTAAIYGARAGIKTIVIVGDTPGGLLLGAGSVENMPGVSTQPGYKIMNTMQEQAESFGVEFVYNAHVTSIEEQKIAEEMQKIESKQFCIVCVGEEESISKTIFADAIIIASGSTPKKLGIIGEDTYWGAGVTSCAVCDGMRVRGDSAIVVGGGDTAIEHVLHLQQYACTTTLVVRESALRASEHMQQKLQALDTVSIVYNSVIECIEGDGVEMTQAMIKNTKTGAVTTLQAKGLFLAIGHVPNSSFCPSSVELLSDGTVLLPTRSQQTTCPGIFAAGDVADNTYRQACIAAGSGAQSALEAVAYMRR